MAGFLGKPTRGGWLTILNCGMWAVVAIGIATDSTILLFPALVACWPLAWLCMFPLGLHSRASETVMTCIAIGVNSPCWGYGLSWLCTLPARFKRNGPQSPRRGFDVIVTPTGIPAATRTPGPDRPG